MIQISEPLAIAFFSAISSGFTLIGKAVYDSKKKVKVNGCRPPGAAQMCIEHEGDIKALKTAIPQMQTDLRDIRKHLMGDRGD